TALERLAREEGRRQALTDTLRDLDEELARLADRRARLETAPALEQETEAQLGERRAVLADVEARLAERHTEWVRDRQEAETKRQALRQQWQELRDQRDRLAALGPDGPCPTCTRPLGANFTSMLDMLGDQLDTVKVDGEYFKRRLDQLAEMPADVRELEARRKELQQETTALERRLARCQAASAELAQAAREHVAKDERRTQVAAELAALPTGYDPVRHRRLRADVEQMAAQEQRQARLQERLARSEQVAAERGGAAARLDSVAARLAELRASVAEGAAAEEGYERLRRDVEDAQAGARASELAAVQAEGDRRNAATALDGARTAERRLAEARVKLGELQRDRRLHDELDRAYGDLRTDLNFALRPELSEIASAFLAELTDDRYSELELDDQYNVIVLEDGIPKPVISGGEEDLANLVLRLAISQMIAERAGQTFSLLILDEVFGSLDESRRLNVVDLLRGLQDRFEQVILITHIESVREGVDRVVEVRYDEERGTSVVRQRDGGTEAEEADDAALAFEVAS
ncbi:MAG TPA: SbcC/MukB-like Walker B domain-containing protein, partial [Gemmatimonadaceae bacterium]|nr:SbcC/MukB-like Walker B domain-containing protein [Gemmatimonadaceae bacterium]